MRTLAGVLVISGLVTLSWGALSLHDLAIAVPGIALAALWGFAIVLRWPKVPYLMLGINGLLMRTQRIYGDLGTHSVVLCFSDAHRLGFDLDGSSNENSSTQGDACSCTQVCPSLPEPGWIGFWRGIISTRRSCSNVVLLSVRRFLPMFDAVSRHPSSHSNHDERKIIDEA